MRRGKLGRGNFPGSLYPQSMASVHTVEILLLGFWESINQVKGNESKIKAQGFPFVERLKHPACIISQFSGSTFLNNQTIVGQLF